MSPDIVPCPQVNGVCVEGKQHADVVAAIKAGGDETRLLVVDVLTDEFFKKCKVVPSKEHLAGGLGAVLQGRGFVPTLPALCHLVTKRGGAGGVPKRWEVEVSSSWGQAGSPGFGTFLARPRAPCQGGEADVGSVGRQVYGPGLHFGRVYGLGSEQAAAVLCSPPQPRLSSGPLPAVTVVPGRMGGGVSLGSVLGLSSWGCSRCPAASPHAVGLSARGGLKKIGTWLDRGGGERWPRAAFAGHCCARRQGGRANASSPSTRVLTLQVPCQNQLPMVI